jgi:hypothetical protein
MCSNPPCGPRQMYSGTLYQDLHIGPEALLCASTTALRKTTVGFENPNQVLDTVSQPHQ